MKAEYHLNRSNITDFANALIDICLLVKPAFTVVDAVECMEGNGPTGGNPRHVGLIAASDDPFTLDIAMAGVINIAPKDIPVCAESVKRGLCPSNAGDIEFIGGRLLDFAVRDFAVPKTKPINVTEKMPKAMYRFVNDILSRIRNLTIINALDAEDARRTARQMPSLWKTGRRSLTGKNAYGVFAVRSFVPRWQLT